MAYNSTVYSVKHVNGTWNIYVDGQMVVKSENPGATTGRYNYHRYLKKTTAVGKARKMAKKDRAREFSQGRVQLKVFNKTGSKTTEVSNYD